jgi:hypothetical protein
MSVQISWSKGHGPVSLTFSKSLILQSFIIFSETTLLETIKQMPIYWAFVIFITEWFTSYPLSQIKCTIFSSGHSESSFIVGFRCWTLKNVVYYYILLSQVFSVFLSPR